MKYVVGYADFFENDLILEVVVANSIREAVTKHSRLHDPDYEEWFKDLPEDLEDIKQFFFDGDMLVSVLEL